MDRIGLKTKVHAVEGMTGGLWNELFVRRCRMAFGS